MYHCPSCGGLLEVAHDLDALRDRSGAAWMKLFDDRYKVSQWPYGSGVWGKREWVMPELPDELIVNMIRRRLEESRDGHGFVLDGFPRTAPQAKALQELLTQLDSPIDLVAVLEHAGRDQRAERPDPQEPHRRVAGGRHGERPEREREAARDVQERRQEAQRPGHVRAGDGARDVQVGARLARGRGDREGDGERARDRQREREADDLGGPLLGQDGTDAPGDPGGGRRLRRRRFPAPPSGPRRCGRFRAPAS